MGTLTGMTRDDGQRIGYVLSALGSDAIDAADLRRWCEALLRDNDAADIPAYVFDLLEFDGKLADVYKVVGFVPSSGLTANEKRALYGIAVLRGVVPLDWPVTKEAALRSLEACPDVMRRFQEEFAFVAL